VDLTEKVVEIVQRLIRFDTTNPPGNEAEAQEYLASYLRSVGLEVELLGASSERPNLIARLKGARPGKRLCYLGHIDTVLANPEEWQVDPWSGEVKDGYIWGRGALDMKSQVAAEVVAVAELARSGWRPESGELMVIVCVDEETGGSQGAQWLTSEHAEKVQCDLLINEGGGATIEFAGSRYYTLGVAEKGVYRFSVTTKGRAGHASVPQLADNSLLKMAPVLEAFAKHSSKLAISQEGRDLLTALGGSEDSPALLIEQLKAESPELAALIEPMLAVTFAPTRIFASDKVNVVPSKSTLQVDCRVPPGTEESVVSEKIESVLKDCMSDATYEFRERVSGSSSGFNTVFADQIKGWIKEHDSEAKVLPFMLPGFTDSRWFRNCFPECQVYGFFPQKVMSMDQSMSLMHAADERVPVDDLSFATQFFYELPQRVFE